MGMAKPAVAHKSKTAKQNFFIEFLEMEVVKTKSSNWFQVGLQTLDASRGQRVGVFDLGRMLAVPVCSAAYFSP